MGFRGLGFGVNPHLGCEVKEVRVVQAKKDGCVPHVVLRIHVAVPSQVQAAF